MKRNDKTNIFRNWRNFVCVACCITCLICVAITFKYKAPMSVDLMSVLVGILAFLVTVIAVMQAFNYFIFEKRINERIDKVIGEVRIEMEGVHAEVNDAINDIKLAVRAFHMQDSSSEDIVFSMGGTIRGCLEGLLIDRKSNTQIATKEIFNDLCIAVGMAKDNAKFIDTSKKYDYISALRNIDDERVDGICEFILSCQDIKERKVPN